MPGRPRRDAAPSRIARLTTFGELVDLHIADMREVGKAPLRSKAATLEHLKRELGACNLTSLDRERLIRFGRDRAAQGSGPVTLGIDIGAVKLVVSWEEHRPGCAPGRGNVDVWSRWIGPASVHAGRPAVTESSTSVPGESAAPMQARCGQKRESSPTQSRHAASNTSLSPMLER